MTKRPHRPHHGKGQRGAGGRPPRGEDSPRKLAAGIVRGVLEGRGAARTHLDRAGDRLGPRDLGLVTELVYGVVRRVATLDAVLEGCARGGLARVEDDVLATLRVAAYQLLFLDHVPAAVAVSEAVESLKEPHLRGYVNGVLRGVGRALERRTQDDAVPAGVPSTRRLPGREHGWVILGLDLLPSAEKDPAAWLAAACSFPQALAAGWVARWGLEGALEVARAQNEAPPMTLRVNTLRTTREALLERLRASGLEAQPGALDSSVRLGSSLQSEALDVVDEGLAAIQDETAQRVAPLLEPRPGERVLDLTAAPGGKVAHAAELMADSGRLDAIDVDEGRLARVRDVVTRFGLKSVVVSIASEADPRPPQDPRPIDRVLVDVPCSNTGVLRRRVEARWRLDELDWASLEAVQTRLLERALDLVRPGGVVVYSTCSIEAREDEERVRAVLARRPDVTLEVEHLVLPTRGGGDGGYMARLRRAPQPT